VCGVLRLNDEQTLDRISKFLISVILVRILRKVWCSSSLYGVTNMKHRPCRIAIAAALACQFSLTSAASSEEAETPLPPQAEEAVAPQAPAEPQAPVEQVESAQAPLSPSEEIEAPAAGPAPKADNVFTLGEITVSGKTENEVSPLAPDTLDSEQLNDFGRKGLPEALRIMPGVTVSPGSGSRNEANVYVRGFDRWRVPFLLDGIRLYLPADNRIDFNRFLTPDLAEIQVSKGYVSVLNGPDGMAGAINLVTRKPTKKLEGEVSASASFADNGHYNGNTLFGGVGTKQEAFYLQATAEERNVRSWYLPDEYKGTIYQDEGKRDRSDSKDWRGTLKFGFTPNATDEYSLNFMKQEGEKRKSDPVDRTPERPWDWPKWDVWSLYWLSNTQLGDKSYVKTRAYFNKFDNVLLSSDPANPTNSGRNFESTYDDKAFGANVEFGTDIVKDHTFKASLFWRRDEHRARDVYPSTVSPTPNGQVPANRREPWQETVEDVFSIAGEETWHVTPKFDLVFGLSRDFRHTGQAEEFGRPVAGANYQRYRLPTEDKNATNYQIASIWRYSDSGKAHLFWSDRTRFATVFERFSSGFGTVVSNPTLKPERAQIFELGVENRISANVIGNAAVFYSEVDDYIVGVDVYFPTPINATYTVRQNVGTAYRSGIELGITATPSDSLEIGANYSYLHAKVRNPDDPAERMENLPHHSGFIYAKWWATPKFFVIPMFEVASRRWSSYSPSSGVTNYVLGGSYELLSLKLGYQITKQWEVAITGNNLLDKYYELSTGFPQEGRNYMLSTRLQF
jgi:iron complex outermembrane receptor protein